MPLNQIEENVLPPVRLIYSYMNITTEADVIQLFTIKKDVNTYALVF